MLKQCLFGNDQKASYQVAGYYILLEINTDVRLILRLLRERGHIIWKASL